MPHLAPHDIMHLFIALAVLLGCLILAVIQGAGTHADSRALVVARFLALKDRQSVLGTYSIDGGDPSIAPFVVAHPVGGRLVPSNRS